MMNPAIDIDASITSGTGLPKGWRWSPLSEIADNLDNKRKPINSKERETRQGDVPYYGATGQVGWIDKHLLDEELVLVGEDGAPFLEAGRAKAYMIRGKSWVNNHAHVLRAKDGMPNEYLMHYLNILDYSPFVSGTTRLKLTKGAMAKIPVPVAPLPEQRRIVSAIETQLGRLDAAVARLHGAKAQLKRYKQAVLKAAVEGALTEEWREKNPNVEPATKLIERLALLRKIEWERQKKAGERRSMLQSESAEEQVQIDIDLPDSWTWATPEEIASAEPYSIGIGPFGSNLKVSDYTDEGVPLIFIRHITSENFDLGLKYTSERKYKELIAHVAKPLDVLVAKMGDPPGDAVIYPADRAPGVMTADCIKLRVWDPLISREYVMHCIRSYVVKQQLGLITMGVAQKKISTGRFKTLLFPMPPTEEQYAIAVILADRFERCRVTEEMIAAQLVHSTRLRQSVLKRAFEGRLV